MNMILNRQAATILPGAKLGALQRAPKGCAPGMARIKIAKKNCFSRIKNLAFLASWRLISFC
jgi:hypothetical protein